MITRSWFIAVAFFALTMHASAGDSYILKSHTMKVDGTSTLHDWTTPVEKVRAKADLTLSQADITELKAMWVECDVMSITSEKGETMEEKIQEAFKVENGFKAITFNMTSIKELKKVGSSYNIVADGTLTMAGQKKPITMTVTGTVSGADVVFKGEQKIKMSNWGMERPSAMFGTIKAGDDVKVSFTITMKKS